MNWDAIFTYRSAQPGATADELALLKRTLFAPMSAEELLAARKQADRNPFSASDPLHNSFRPFDPALWKFPLVEVSANLLEFLGYSNGGEFSNGERHFQFFPALHPTGGLRAMLLAYEFPEYMPMALPFAFNGGGTFYIFDLRCSTETNEYPVVASHASSLGWESDEYWFVANTFEEACCGKTNIDDLRNDV